MLKAADQCKKMSRHADVPSLLFSLSPLYPPLLSLLMHPSSLHPSLTHSLLFLLFPISFHPLLSLCLPIPSHLPVLARGLGQP